MKTIIPKRLKKGDTVGIVSPSGRVRNRLGQFKRGVKKLKEMGLKVKYSKHVFDEYYYSAGTRDIRLNDFHRIWSDPKVKMVLMSQGGYTANQLLDGLDYGMIKKNPKIFAGISDGTTLLNAIYAKTGLVTYHGPDLMWTFGLSMPSLIEENIKKTFFEGKVELLAPNPKWKHEKKKVKYKGWKCVRKGKASGTLVGGHIACLGGIMLSGYGPNMKNKILFLEGTDEIAELDWYFTTLKLNGVFKQIKGLILGWFDNHEAKHKNERREVADMVMEITKEYKFPILEVGELGHCIDNYVFPIGVSATIDAGRKQFSIDGKTVL